MKTANLRLFIHLYEGNMAKTLVNFLVEQEQLDRFDAVAEILGRTRTSLLVSFMQQFCLDQVVEIEKRNHKLDQLSAALERQRILAEQRGYLSSVPVHRDARDDDLPGMFVSDGWEGF